MTKSKRLVVFGFITALFIMWLAFDAGANLLQDKLKQQKNTQSILPAEQVFRLYTNFNNNKITASWQILPAHYLYQDAFKFELVHGTTSKLIEPNAFPEPQTLLLDNQTYRVYENGVSLTVVLNEEDRLPNSQMIIHYQGCAKSGFCYPPQQQTLSLAMDDSFSTTEFTKSPTPQSTLSFVFSQHLSLVFLTFLLIGVGLTFTPCVLPMLPILSSIIIGDDKNVGGKKAFGLSVAYVLSMSTTFALAGILAATAGQSLQAFFQLPWVITVFAGLFILLGLAMMDVFHLKVPQFAEQRLHNIHAKHTGGRYVSAVLMGLISTLVVSPCLTPALAGSLIYISETGDKLMGGTALFAMGLGMGIPLVIIGTFEGLLLPKSGPWLHHIKALFGFVLFGLAIWLVSRIISEQIILGLWGLLVVGLAIQVKAFKAHTKRPGIISFIHLVLTIYGIVLLVGAILGNESPIRPLENLTQQPYTVTSENTALHFKSVDTLNELNQTLQQAKTEGRPVIIDFYADWCTICKILEKKIFGHPTIINMLNTKNTVLIKVDVTTTNEHLKILMQQLQVFGPPTLLFYDRSGQEQLAHRVVGSISRTAFINIIEPL